MTDDVTQSRQRTWVPDLFGEPTSARRGGRGRRRYVPTRERQTQVVELRGAGFTIAAIAAELGVSQNTLFRHYALELGSESMLCLTLAQEGKSARRSPRPGGRPTHKPTPEKRALVCRLAMERRSPAAIARALGIAPQTLAKHYALELRALE